MNILQELGLLFRFLRQQIHRYSSTSMNFGVLYFAVHSTARICKIRGSCRPLGLATSWTSGETCNARARDNPSTFPNQPGGNDHSSRIGTFLQVPTSAYCGVTYLVVHSAARICKIHCSSRRSGLATSWASGKTCNSRAHKNSCGSRVSPM